MTDILSSIDEVVAAHESCGCGCGQKITDRSASPFYASEACQTKWMQQGKGLKPIWSSRSPRYASLPINLEPTIRPRPTWPDGPSVYDLMAHIVTWLNANGIPAIDVPVAEVAQLHDGHITVWTWERPRRLISEAEGAARTLVTVPMVVAPPDELQPWLRGECRESVPFVSAEMAEVDAVLRHVATRDRPAEEQQVDSGSGEVTVAVDVSRDGTGALAVSNGDRVTLVTPTTEMTQEQVDEFAARFREAVMTHRTEVLDEHTFRRESLGEWPLDPQPEPRAPLVDAALQEPYRRPWWRFW